MDSQRTKYLKFRFFKVTSYYLPGLLLLIFFFFRSMNMVLGVTSRTSLVIVNKM